MLRRLTTLTFLTATLSLTACQSLYAYLHRTDTTRGETVTTGDRNQVGFDSALAYNKWQWNYFSKLAKTFPNNYQSSTPTGSVSTSEFIFDKVLRTSDGNVWDFSTEKKILKKHSWNNLKGADSKQCMQGLKQSPINIVKALVPLTAVNNSDYLRYHYQPQNFTVLDNGHSIVFKANNPQKTGIHLQGKLYYLNNMQYRAISEHTIMGVHLPLELQLTHVAKDGETAIISIMVNTGPANRQIQNLVNSLPTSDNPTATNKLINFNAGKLIPNYGFYAYDGSLTVPPCSENVKWLVATRALTADVQQLYRLESKYSGNMRDLQPQGGRTVYFIK